MLKVDREILAIALIELSIEQLENVCYETYLCTKSFNGSKKEKKQLKKYYKTIMQMLKFRTKKAKQYVDYHDFD